MKEFDFKTSCINGPEIVKIIAADTLRRPSATPNIQS
jgi:hypothetical protein